MNLKKPSEEELKNTLGGSWWKVKAVYGEIVFIFHLYNE